MGVEKGMKIRKIRSDRKRDVKPVIPVDLYDCIARISYVTNRPIKHVGETLLIEGLCNKNVLDDLSSLFRREYRHLNEFGDPIIYPGDPNRIPIKVDRGDGNRARLSMRFHQEVHDQLCSLSYALDLTVSSASVVLIQYAFINDLGLAYIERNIEETLDPKRLEQLKEILKFMNQFNSPDDRITIPKLLAYLANQIYNETKTVKDVLYEFIHRSSI